MVVFAIIFMIGGSAKAAGFQNSHERDSERHESGSNYWGDSNLRSWLNSDKGVGEVIWLDNNPPDYENEAGFLNGFTLDEKNAIKTVKNQYLLAIQDSEVPGAYEVHGEYYEKLADKVFLLNDDIAISLDESLKIASLTKNLAEIYKETTVPWLIYPTSPQGGPSGMPTIGITGDVEGVWANITAGVRPAFYLDDVGLNGSGTDYEPYTLGGAKNTSDIKEGDYLKLGTYNGEPVIWICVYQSLNGPLMLSEKILSVKAFDAPGSNIGGHDKNIFTVEEETVESTDLTKEELAALGINDYVDFTKKGEARTVPYYHTFNIEFNVEVPKSEIVLYENIYILDRITGKIVKNMDSYYNQGISDLSDPTRYTYFHLPNDSLYGLKPDKEYILVIKAGIKPVAGEPLKKDAVLLFRVK